MATDTIEGIDLEPDTPAEPAFSMHLTQDQKDLRDWVHGFAKGVVRPAAHEWDEREETPWPIIQEAAKIGLTATRAWPSSSPTLRPLTADRQRGALLGRRGHRPRDHGHRPRRRGDLRPGHRRADRRVDPPLLRHRRRAQGRGLLLLGARRRLRRVRDRTTAKFDEAANEWVINGNKSWATNGGISDIHVIIASVDRELGARGHAAFVVPMSEAKGIEMGAKVKKHGLRASHTSDVHLDDCRVPAEYVLGGKEKLDARIARAREGVKARSNASMATFEATRPTVGAQALGVARGAYEYALDYAKERSQFGRPIIENQAIAFTLARMKMEIDAARLLVWRAAWMGRNQVPFTNAEGSMSKLKAGEVAVWVTERAMQILGGNGYTREFPVERMHRDAKIYDIFEGTAEIQQLVIARAISGMQIR